MKRKYFKKIIWPIFIKVLFTLLILTVIVGCVSNPGYPKEDPNKIYGPFSSTLSPDGKKVIFFWKKGPQGGMSELATYEISTGELHKLKATNNDYHTDPVYSPDGKKIAFIAAKKHYSGNVFIMDADGGNVRQLTFNNDRYPENGGKYQTNALPTFSPDGRKIIFVRSGTILTRPTDMKANWDVYEVDILTGTERRMTSHRLFLIRRPYLMPDGRSFIFSGDNFSKEYKQKYGENQIYLMSNINTELKPTFLYGDQAFSPSVDGTGNIVFLADTNHIDGKGRYVYDVFIIKRGKITRLSQMHFTGCIDQPFISYNGSRIVFEACKKGSLGPTPWLMNSDGTGLTEVKIDFSGWE